MRRTHLMCGAVGMALAALLCPMLANAAPATATTTIGTVATEGSQSEDGYVYGYTSMTWAEYYAGEEGVANRDDVRANPVPDSNREPDRGGYDVVTRATTAHGVQRCDFQTAATIHTQAGKTYVVDHWAADGTVFYDSTGAAHTYDDGTIDGADVLASYDMTGPKHVPVAVKASDLPAFEASGHTLVKNGSALAGGVDETKLSAFEGTAAVDANTNGLKVASVAADGTVSFSAAKRDGTTSGLAGRALRVVDLAAMDPMLSGDPGASGVGHFGESIRLNFTEDFAELAEAMQAVEWTYYGTDATRTQTIGTYGTKFAADNWVNARAGIELGLTDSYRADLFGKGYDGTGYWRVTIHALGFRDATYDFEVAARNVNPQTLASDETMARLTSLVTRAEALDPADYTADSWSIVAPRLTRAKDYLAESAHYEEEATDVADSLERGLGFLVRATPVAPAVDKAALEAAIGQARAIEQGKKSDAAFASLGAAIAAAQTVVDDEAAAQAQVDAAADAVRQAVAEFEASADVSRVERLAGSAESGAAGTAAAIAAEAFAGSTADTVVVARNDDYHDALAASGLAGALGAPILLTDRGGLSQAAADEIEALGATKAVILGGTSAVSDQVRADLADLGLEVDRLGGEDVYGTSMAINQRLVETEGADAANAVVVSPTTFADALSISGWAYANKVPVMLQTWGDTSAERGFDERAGEILQGRHLIVCGGEQAVSSASVSAIDPGFERLGGETIYDTSLAIAGWELDHGMSAKDVTVASAIPDYDGVDALAGSALAGRAGGVTLLAQSNGAFGWYDGGEAALGFIEAHASDIQRVHVLGGEVASTPALYDAIREALGEDAE